MGNNLLFLVPKNNRKLDKKLTNVSLGILFVEVVRRKWK